MKKQGLFFTMMSIGMMTLIILIITPLFSPTESSNAEQFRLQVVDNFIQEVEDSFLVLALQVAGVRALNATLVEIDTQNSLMNNAHSEIPRVILEGKANIGGGGLRSIMDNHTILNFTKDIALVAKRTYDMDLQIGVENVSIRQFSPWEVRVRGNFSLNATTPFANWTKTSVIVHRFFSIEGFADPQYLLFEDVYRPIYRSSLLPQNWTVEELDAFIMAENYTHFQGSSAPSFLQRFNILPNSSPCCSIESVVNPDVVSLGVVDRSYADHAFFADNVPCTDLFVVNNLPSIVGELKLGLAQVVYYNVTEHVVNYTGCP